MIRQMSRRQFELDMEPHLKPPAIGQAGAGEGAAGGGANDSRDLSFSHIAKGRRRRRSRDGPLQPSAAGGGWRRWRWRRWR